jgi:hypothetical protein
MAAKKSPKRVKKVTEIPDAKVTIEVDEIENEDESTITESPKSSEAEKENEEEGETVEEKAESEETEDQGEETPDEEVKEKESQTEVAQNSDEPFSDDPNSDSFSWKKVIIFAVIAALIGFVIVGGFLYFKAGYSVNVSKKDVPKTLDIPTKEPTPTPKEVDKSKYQIEVLNGSGIPGEAAAVQEILEKAGFSVGAIGNADSANYTDTVISVTKEVEEEFVDELKETLEKRGPVEVEEAEDQDEDVIVTVGSSLEDETETTPTP